MDTTQFGLRNAGYNVADDSGSGAEGPARKIGRFNKSTVENERPGRRQTSLFNSTKPSVETKSTIASRRRSTLREHRAPSGPRPLDRSPSKRIASDASSAAPHNSTRTFLPTSSSEPFFNARPPTNTNQHVASNTDISKGDGRETDFSEFLPSINFDEFHSSLASNDLQLSQFPAPGGTQKILSNTGTKGNARRDTSSQESLASKGTTTAQKPKGPSLMRQLSNARQTSQSSATDPSMPPPTAPLPVRTRRQSQFPAAAATSTTSSNSGIARAPRKSVGPGVLASSLAGKDNSRQSPTKSTGGPPALGRSASTSRPTRRNISTNTNPDLLSIQSGPATPRNIKAKSVHSPSFQNSLTPEPSKTTGMQNLHSPGRHITQQRTQTPSSSANKRQSVHGHVGGLGARTISPTDAHRLKRLSIMPDQAAMPQTPPTPLPDYPYIDNRTGQSPSMIPRKSVTPSSARVTPDPNAKSRGSGLSLSSSSSFSSLQNSGQNRWSQTLSTSRLPTPKPRTVHSSAGVHDSEEVPPVPAIPKAYESPRDVPDQPFFDHLYQLSQGNHPGDEDLSRKTPSHEQIPNYGQMEFDYAAFEEPQKPPQDTKRHRRGLTVGTGSDAEKPQPLHQSSRRNLQPLRLPPLNLLPIGSTNNTRLDSIPTPGDDGDRGVSTPPPKRNTRQTPSTPMTASKAMFPRREFTDDGLPPPVNLRSNSSHFGIAGGSNFHDEYTFPTGVSISNNRQATTPFASTSLPKSGGVFNRLVASPEAENEDSALNDNPPDYMPQKTPAKLFKAKKDTSTSIDSSGMLSDPPESPPSGSSLRRKLSARFKRSASKNSHVTQASNDTQGPQPPKHQDMPPPRLPASATFSGATETVSSPLTNTRPSLDARRRKSSTVNSDANAAQRHNNATQNAEQAAHPSSHSEHVNGTNRAASSSIFSLSSRKSISTLKARNLEFNLDKDDLAADEEMKKLASKRRDFELAAREVDELRKRATAKERVSPTQALNMVNLNLFERGEIIDYREVYFCGTKSAKKVFGDLNAQSANFGYDDERGDYNIVYGDHLSYRYEVVDLLGKGSFGQVVRCVDHKTGQLVAVKIIRNKKRFHQQALVEVNILQKLREWDPLNKHSMINFTQSFYFRGHLCISTELLGMNLYEFIKAHDFKGFSLKLIRRFTKQMLNALVLLKGHRVIHCDLKPENILLAHPLHSEIKIIDFGSSCFENEKVYTYIQSRFYRSPEVILGMSYGLPIDMWSLGCILAELLTGYPIFPGENEQEQLACIMEVFGPPEKHLIEKSTRKKLFFDSVGKPRVTISSKNRRRRPSSKTLQGVLKCDDEAFLDFLTRCLRWDPDRRLKPEEALHHDFVTGAKRTGTASRANGPRAQAINGTTSAATNGNVASSPIKRITSTQHPHAPRTRPLPEPPAAGAGLKPAISGITASRDGGVSSSSSPNKSTTTTGGPRRHSTVNGAPMSAGTKRTSNGAAVGAGAGTGMGAVGQLQGQQGQIGTTSGGGNGSSLPRAAQRSASGKPDLASAAAIASLVS
ncbi:MAG: hypothetical protein M1820_008879 [Bogoriella megaspora]|nr:MAG: hypothetical protein M1820_008879 [Bogoriella megaspora]